MSVLGAFVRGLMFEGLRGEIYCESRGEKEVKDER